MSQPTEVTEATFEQEVIHAKLPVLVDFWAPWCGPCRMVGPVLEKIAADHGEQLKVVKVNVDQNPTLAQKFGIFSIPNLLYFKEGKLAGQWVGFQPEKEILNKLGL
jgi:thioredoxin 1